MNYRIIYKDELYHYGVKGMKWGVRKQQAVQSFKTRSSKQLSASKAYSKRHSTGGILARQWGKSVALGITVGVTGGLLALPLSAALGPGAGVAIATGAKYAGGLLAANNMAKAGTSIYYKHQKTIDQQINKARKTAHTSRG